MYTQVYGQIRARARGLVQTDVCVCVRIDMTESRSLGVTASVEVGTNDPPLSLLIGTNVLREP